MGRAREILKEQRVLEPAEFRIARIVGEQAFLQKGQVDEAIAHYQMALEIKPDKADAHSNLGTAFVQKGRVDEAIAHYQKALEIKPNFADAHGSLGSAFLQKVKFQQRYEKRHGNLLNLLCAKELCLRGAPNYRRNSSSQFWGLDSDRILKLVLREIILSQNVSPHGVYQMHRFN
jgi:tetratricopeptide (TPR) repeat protein